MADAMEALIDAIAERVRLRIYLDFQTTQAEHANHIMRLEQRLDEINPANTADPDIDYAKLAEEISLHDLAQEFNVTDIAQAFDLDDTVADIVREMDFQVRVR